MHTGILKQQINGVKTGPLKKTEDDRGSVLHIMRREFYGNGPIGEVYGSFIKPGKVKAWKRNLTCTQNLVVVWGQVQFIMYDEATGTLQEEIIGGPRHAILQIPAGIWYGFKGDKNIGGLVINTTEVPHEEMEIEQLDINTNKIPHVW